MTSTAATALLVAIVAQEPAAMRAAPRENAPKQGLLWRGEWLEVRGTRRDYLNVYSHRLERPGFVHRSLVRQHRLTAEQAPDLRAVVAFLHDSPGLESLGIGYVALYLRAAPAATLDAWLFDALGTFARRLAHQASAAVANESRQRHLAAHLDVARSYGVRFVSHEQGEQNQLCYDGDAFRRVLSFGKLSQLPLSAELRARAALALSEPRCRPPDLAPGEQRLLLQHQLALFDAVDTAQVLPYLANRVRLRRSGLAALLAYQQARAAERQAATRSSRTALDAFLRVDKTQLAARDRKRYDRAALRVAAVRWARESTPQQERRRIALVLEPRSGGKTCVKLRQRAAKNDRSLYERCTYGLVWRSSVRVSPDGKQLSVAVQQQPGWLETWVFRQIDNGWTVDTLVPAPSDPELGYVEVAGWTPGGRELLVVREALVEGHVQRHFQALRRSDLSPRVDARSLRRFHTFNRWHSADWRSKTLALR